MAFLDCCGDMNQLIVVCAWCHVIQHPRGPHVPESQIVQSSDVTFTICPLCVTRYFDSTDRLAYHVLIGQA